MPVRLRAVAFALTAAVVATGCSGVRHDAPSPSPSTFSPSAEQVASDLSKVLAYVDENALYVPNPEWSAAKESLAKRKPTSWIVAPVDSA